MSKHEWKPGTVAVATVRGVPNVRVYRGLTGWAAPADPGRGLNVGVLREYDVTNVRPLVVLDPQLSGVADIEDLRPVGIRAYAGVMEARGSVGAANLLRYIADQIEAQVGPPKCDAAVNIAGEHFGCVEPDNHGGGHRNPYAQAVWGEPA